jgi:hypothetical protein
MPLCRVSQVHGLGVRLAMTRKMAVEMLELAALAGIDG